jgi:hypothetical protein
MKNQKLRRTTQLNKKLLWFIKILYKRDGPIQRNTFLYDNSNNL